MCPELAAGSVEAEMDEEGAFCCCCCCWRSWGALGCDDIALLSQPSALEPLKAMPMVFAQPLPPPGFLC